MKILRVTYNSLWALFAVLGVWLVMALWPASYWHDTGLVLVRDHPQGENFEVSYSGGPVREFEGSYTVVMRRASDNHIPSPPVGAPEATGGPFPYVPGSIRPSPVTIKWWAAQNWEPFVEVSPDAYFIDTCWRIHRPFGGLFPDKITCERSNVFNVLPREK